MKKTLLLCVVLLLASCIPVDDLGVYWDKGVIDNIVIGSWKPQDDKGPTGKDMLVLAQKEDVYRIDGIERGKPGYRPLFGRTLHVGPYSFLMTQPQPGGASALIRYTVEGGELRLYALDDKAMYALLVDKYPHLTNASVDSASLPHMRIKKLDETVFRLLSDIPDTEGYWHVDSRLKRP